MDVLYVGPIPPLPGGISQHSQRLIGTLVGMGHSVRVLSWRKQYPSVLYKGTTQPILEASDHRFLLSWWNPHSWWVARRLARRVDMLVFPFVTPFHAIPYRFIAGGARSTTVIVHNVLPHERMPFERLLVRWVLSAADKLVTHGATTDQKLSEIRIRTPRSRVAMPPLLDVHPTALPALGGEAPVLLLFFGFVRPYKGLDVAVRALSVLADRGFNTRLTVMGEFWQSSRSYTDLAAELGCSEHLQVIEGYATDEDLLAALSAHHLVVAPYVEDTLSGVVPVAFGAGRPVVSTHVAGLSEQVTDGVNGVLVTPRDPVALADGIVRASQRLQSLAAGAAATASRWETVAEAILSPPQFASAE